MKEMKHWFGWIVIVLPLHMGEQLLFGIDELAVIKRLLASYLSYFSDPDYGTVLLVTLAATLIFVIVYALLKGGRARLIAMGFFALVSVSEIHHVVEMTASVSYNPGIVTALPFIFFGIMLARAIVREYKTIPAVAY